MSKLRLVFCFLLFGFYGVGQTDVIFKIEHKLGAADFVLGAEGVNNLGNAFTASRLEYYITRITIVHDGGVNTSVPDEVVALVRPQDEISTSILLGNYSVETVEAVKFHVGVYEPLNNEDLTLFPEEHPLSPKSPSMHWGWDFGYKFLVYEGSNGEDFSQAFSLHGIGNEYYFEVATAVTSEATDEGLVVTTQGDYARGLDDINLDVDHIIIEHGGPGAAKKALENWRDLVFTPYVVNVIEEMKNTSISVYPNPSNGIIDVILSDVEVVSMVEIFDVTGKVLASKRVNNETQVRFEILEAGSYVVRVSDAFGDVLATQKVIVH